MKEMEETLAKLHELIDSFETEKAEDEDEEEDEEDAEEEEEAEEEEDEEEEKAEEEDEEKSESTEKVDDLEKAIHTLKKHGLNIYTGKKRTPAPKRSTPKPTNWSEFSKSLDEVDRLAEKAGRGY
jgi:FtsZ-interacting cell division protein YlmF